MAEIIYKTKAECLASIETFKAIGLDPEPWMLRQLKEFEEAEKANAEASNTDTPIWSKLKACYPYGSMPQEKIDCVESTVAQLLEEGPRAEEPGLLLGKIQCGKTDTFEDIIGLSFDRGVDIAIIITKGTKALVNQTIMRSKHDYRFFKESDDLAQRATINIYDIMKIKSGLKRTQANGKIVIVCKKNARNLDHLINLFETKSPFLKKKKVLIVDDEADFASRNYRAVKPEEILDENGNPVRQKRELDMAKISQQIDDFRKVPEWCRYLQVTATPYCLYLQPSGELNLNGNFVKPFRPRFTSLVPVHDKYIGGEEYFIKSQDPNSMYSHLFHQVDQKCIDVLGHEDKRYINSSLSSGNIYGLTYALVSYFMATAIRRIQVRENENKNYRSSAVFPVEIDKKNHEWQQRVINRLIDSIKNVIVNEDQSDQRIWTAIDVNYQDFFEANKKGRAITDEQPEPLITVDLPSKEEVLDEIRDIFNPKKHNYHVQLVNSDEQMDSLLNEETGELRLDTAANIFIGGNILDRGVTIKNMLCFFYGRNPKNFQQDTVLQHARMYGARSKEDMAVTRLHTTSDIHSILVRINELDEQLRQWFISGKDKEEPNAVFIGFDKHIKPCATSKIKASNALIIKPQKRFVPSGFWTGYKTAISKTIEKIDRLLTESPDYHNQDEDGIFTIDRDLAQEILELIESTYVYDPKFYNMHHKNDIKEMMCALHRCLEGTDGKLFALHRVDRELNRIRQNGAFIDAPDDGRTDLKPARAKAVDNPLLMFIKEKGEKNIDEQTGENVGWNNAPFYWPVLLAQQNVSPAMFAIDQKAQGEVAVKRSDILEGIDPSEVLNLTYNGDLELTFGAEGSDYSDREDGPVETRSVKKTTAAKYLEKDDRGNIKLNPDIYIDEEHWHGVYSYNQGQFPFVLRPYKYMVLRTKRDASADEVLLELKHPSTWGLVPEQEFDEQGNLIDRESQDPLINTRDTIIGKDMQEVVQDDQETYCQWIIVYAINKVLKLRKNSIDWAAIFQDEESQDAE